MNNIEELMREFVRSSVLLKRKLYRKDEAATTSPEGVDGPRIEVHTCRLCNRSAVGKGAHVATNLDARSQSCKRRKRLFVRHGLSCSKENRTRKKKRHRRDSLCRPPSAKLFQPKRPRFVENYGQGLSFDGIHPSPTRLRVDDH